MAECAKVEGQSKAFGGSMAVCAKVEGQSNWFSSSIHAMKLSRMWYYIAYNWENINYPEEIIEIQK